jgi:hypothetical protein
VARGRKESCTGASLRSCRTWENENPGPRFFIRIFDSLGRALGPHVPNLPNTVSTCDMLEFIKGRKLQCPELLPGTPHFSRNILFLDISTPRAGKQNGASCLNKAGKTFGLKSNTDLEIKANTANNTLLSDFITNTSFLTHLTISAQTSN